GQTTVMLSAGTLQPFESFIFLSAIGVRFGDLVCRSFGKILDQRCQRVIRLRDLFLAPLRAGHDHKPRPLARFALSSSHSLLKFPLEQIGEAKTGVSP